MVRTTAEDLVHSTSTWKQLFLKMDNAQGLLSREELSDKVVGVLIGRSDADKNFRTLCYSLHTLRSS